MHVLWLRSGIVALGLVAAPALADLPANFGPGAPFATESAGGGTYAYHYGAGSVASTFVDPQGHVTTYATASVTLAPIASITLTATNAMSGAAGSNAHGELRYDYLATIVNPTFNFTVGDAYFNVVNVSGNSSINTTGLNSGLSVTTSAQGGMAQGGQSFNQVYGDGSSGAAYSHSAAYSLGGAGQFQGYETVNGDTVAVFIGTIALYTNLYGTTTTTTTYDFYGYPHQTTTIDHPGATGSLFLDPTIVVNQAFVAASHASGGGVTLSQGVANSPPAAVPEPASWALLIAGFGLTGAVARRRRVAVA